MRCAEGATGSSRLDGGLTEMERVGETVRRGTGYWTPAVHALLAHLGKIGFAGAPRALGIETEGREVLSFVSGGGPSHADDELARVAQLIRALHDSREAGSNTIRRPPRSLG